jgi:hypothetical protein
MHMQTYDTETKLESDILLTLTTEPSVTLLLIIITITGSFKSLATTTDWDWDTDREGVVMKYKLESVSAYQEKSKHSKVNRGNHIK